MDKVALEELKQRVDQLEQLVWSLFRALETYITYNDLQKKKEDDSGDFGEVHPPSPGEIL